MQNQNKSLRALEHLNIAMKLYPESGKQVDQFRSGRGKDLPNWPDWCFLPMAAWYAIVSAENKAKTLSLDLIGDVSKIAAIGTWRYSQGIYRIDQDFMNALVDSEITGTLPSEMLYKLPEWSVYIETPSRLWKGESLYGFWAHLEWDVNTERVELRLLLDCENNLIPIPMHLGPWTISESVERAIVESKTQAKALGTTLSPLSTNYIDELTSQLNPLISILLYLCSEEPEIDDERTPNQSPKYPCSKKTKKGWRLFPADKPRIWSVGATIGTELREASTKAYQATGRTVKAHLRRGHWHGFWMGKRDEDRKMVYRWIPPLVAGRNRESSES